ncbi:hypothetical protein TVAG_415360 [Trichomonas vaginalis G3]|uniref:Uncharacterized protein n=1 Tax=Trichomonas vaginalis (strain ATCC PRA-98 / G3) TaxID=412133 RepID=A2EW66_TRIV3|nr:zebrafish dkey-56m19.5 family [Trichomonas vaginalis G3]EAY03102.1 hypothetical protein TVAG_415360 [Trichomonas vaginalis G3]KAI5513709.1 zebrafish dkey-56m19.5 family [Trichomonas vaginalis G3]|eukprot:XP_001315325.1 hypothetical protein [Trichomonas vaginalis G3]
MSFPMTNNELDIIREISSKLADFDPENLNFISYFRSILSTNSDLLDFFIQKIKLLKSSSKLSQLRTFDWNIIEIASRSNNLLTLRDYADCFYRLNEKLDQFPSLNYDVDDADIFINLLEAENLGEYFNAWCSLKQKYDNIFENGCFMHEIAKMAKELIEEANFSFTFHNIENPLIEKKPLEVLLITKEGKIIEIRGIDENEIYTTTNDENEITDRILFDLLNKYYQKYLNRNSNFISLTKTEPFSIFKENADTLVYLSLCSTRSLSTERFSTLFLSSFKFLQLNLDPQTQKCFRFIFYINDLYKILEKEQTFNPDILYKNLIAKKDYESMFKISDIFMIDDEYLGNFINGLKFKINQIIFTNQKLIVQKLLNVTKDDISYDFVKFLIDSKLVSEEIPLNILEKMLIYRDSYINYHLNKRTHDFHFENAIYTYEDSKNYEWLLIMMRYSQIKGVCKEIEKNQDLLMLHFLFTKYPMIKNMAKEIVVNKNQKMFELMKIMIDDDFYKQFCKYPYILSHQFTATIINQFENNLKFITSSCIKDVEEIMNDCYQENFEFIFPPPNIQLFKKYLYIYTPFVKNLPEYEKFSPAQKTNFVDFADKISEMGNNEYDYFKEKKKIRDLAVNIEAGKTADFNVNPNEILKMPLYQYLQKTDVNTVKSLQRLLSKNLTIGTVASYLVLNLTKIQPKKGIDKEKQLYLLDKIRDNFNSIAPEEEFMYSLFFATTDAEIDQNYTELNKFFWTTTAKNVEKPLEEYKKWIDFAFALTKQKVSSDADYFSSKDKFLENLFDLRLINNLLDYKFDENDDNKFVKLFISLQKDISEVKNRLPKTLCEKLARKFDLTKENPYTYFVEKGLIKEDLDHCWLLNKFINQTHKKVKLLRLKETLIPLSEDGRYFVDDFYDLNNDIKDIDYYGYDGYGFAVFNAKYSVEKYLVDEAKKYNISALMILSKRKDLKMDFEKVMKDDFEFLDDYLSDLENFYYTICSKENQDWLTMRPMSILWSNIYNAYKKITSGYLRMYDHIIGNCMVVNCFLNLFRFDLKKFKKFSHLYFDFVDEKFGNQEFENFDDFFSKLTNEAKTNQDKEKIVKFRTMINQKTTNKFQSCDFSNFQYHPFLTYIRSRLPMIGEYIRTSIFPMNMIEFGLGMSQLFENLDMDDKTCQFLRDHKQDFIKFALSMKYDCSTELFAVIIGTIFGKGVCEEKLYEATYYITHVAREIIKKKPTELMPFLYLCKDLLKEMSKVKNYHFNKLGQSINDIKSALTLIDFNFKDYDLTYSQIFIDLQNILIKRFANNDEFIDLKMQKIITQKLENYEILQYFYDNDKFMETDRLQKLIFLSNLSDTKIKRVYQINHEEFERNFEMKDDHKYDYLSSLVKYSFIVSLLGNKKVKTVSPESFYYVDKYFPDYKNLFYDIYFGKSKSAWNDAYEKIRTEVYLGFVSRPDLLINDNLIDELNHLASIKNNLPESAFKSCEFILNHVPCNVPILIPEQNPIYFIKILPEIFDFTKPLNLKSIKLTKSTKFVNIAFEVKRMIGKPNDDFKVLFDLCENLDKPSVKRILTFDLNLMKSVSGDVRIKQRQFFSRYEDLKSELENTNGLTSCLLSYRILLCNNPYMSAEFSRITDKNISFENAMIESGLELYKDLTVQGVSSIYDQQIFINHVKKYDPFWFCNFLDNSFDEKEKIFNILFTDKKENLPSSIIIQMMEDQINVNNWIQPFSVVMNSELQEEFTWLTKSIGYSPETKYLDQYLNRFVYLVSLSIDENGLSSQKDLTKYFYDFMFDYYQKEKHYYELKQEFTHSIVDNNHLDERINDLIVLSKESIYKEPKIIVKQKKYNFLVKDKFVPKIDIRNDKNVDTFAYLIPGITIDLPISSKNNDGFVKLSIPFSSEISPENAQKIHLIDKNGNYYNDDDVEIDNKNMKLNLKLELDSNPYDSYFLVFDGNEKYLNINTQQIKTKPFVLVTSPGNKFYYDKPSNTFVLSKIASKTEFSLNVKNCFNEEMPYKTEMVCYDEKPIKLERKGNLLTVNSPYGCLLQGNIYFNKKDKIQFAVEEKKFTAEDVTFLLYNYYERKFDGSDVLYAGNLPFRQYIYLREPDKQFDVKSPDNIDIKNVGQEGHLGWFDLSLYDKMDRAIIVQITYNGFSRDIAIVPVTTQFKADKQYLTFQFTTKKINDMKCLLFDRSTQKVTNVKSGDKIDLSNNSEKTLITPFSFDFYYPYEKHANYNVNFENNFVFPELVKNVKYLVVENKRLKLVNKNKLTKDMKLICGRLCGENYAQDNDMNLFVSCWYPVTKDVNRLMSYLKDVEFSNKEKEINDILKFLRETKVQYKNSENPLDFLRNLLENRIKFLIENNGVLRMPMEFAELCKYQKSLIKETPDFFKWLAEKFDNFEEVTFEKDENEYYDCLILFMNGMILKNESDINFAERPKEEIKINYLADDYSTFEKLKEKLADFSPKNEKELINKLNQMIKVITSFPQVLRTQKNSQTAFDVFNFLETVYNYYKHEHPVKSFVMFYPKVEEFCHFFELLKEYLFEEKTEKSDIKIEYEDVTFDREETVIQSNLYPEFFRRKILSRVMMPLPKERQEEFLQFATDLMYQMKKDKEFTISDSLSDEIKRKQSEQVGSFVKQQINTRFMNKLMNETIDTEPSVPNKIDVKKELQENMSKTSKKEDSFKDLLKPTRSTSISSTKRVETQIPQKKQKPKPVKNDWASISFEKLQSEPKKQEKVDKKQEQITKSDKKEEKIEKIEEPIEKSDTKEEPKDYMEFIDEEFPSLTGKPVTNVQQPVFQYQIDIEPEQNQQIQIPQFAPKQNPEPIQSPKLDVILKQPSAKPVEAPEKPENNSSNSEQKSIEEEYPALLSSSAPITANIKPSKWENLNNISEKVEEKPKKVVNIPRFSPASLPQEEIINRKELPSFISKSQPQKVETRPFVAPKPASEPIPASVPLNEVENEEIPEQKPQEPEKPKAIDNKQAQPPQTVQAVPFNPVQMPYNYNNQNVGQMQPQPNVNYYPQFAPQYPNPQELSPPGFSTKSTPISPPNPEQNDLEEPHYYFRPKSAPIIPNQPLNPKFTSPKSESPQPASFESFPRIIDDNSQTVQGFGSVLQPETPKSEENSVPEQPNQNYPQQPQMPGYPMPQQQIPGYVPQYPPYYYQQPIPGYILMPIPAQQFMQMQGFFPDQQQQMLFIQQQQMMMAQMMQQHPQMFQQPFMQPAMPGYVYPQQFGFNPQQNPQQFGFAAAPNQNPQQPQQMQPQQQQMPQQTDNLEDDNNSPKKYTRRR